MTAEMFPGTLESEIARSDEPTALAVLAIAAAFHELDGHKRPLGYHGRGETMRGDDHCPWDARVLYDKLRQRGYELREIDR